MFCSSLGTGKTRTMVAAIREIVHTTQKNILVCAQSNTACDEITLRLRQVLKNEEMLRVYAKSFNKRSIDEKIAPISNLRADSIVIPSLEDLYQFRVIICTILTAGCFTRVREESYYDPSHFDYVFVDEAACVPESVTLIPIAGVCSSPDKIHSQIVLAGDPLQLDAVVKSKYAAKLGYNVSFMEYLFKQTCYKRDSNGDFNPKRIVQLKKNYRSHPAIIYMPNQLFYDGVLEAVASTGYLNYLISMICNSMC